MVMNPMVLIPLNQTAPLFQQRLLCLLAEKNVTTSAKLGVSLDVMNDMSLYWYDRPW